LIAAAKLGDLQHRGGLVSTFIDVHRVDGGASATEVAGAYLADLATETKYGVDSKHYWDDEAAGKIFCLVDAPDAKTAATGYREAHGLVADEIYEVSEGNCVSRSDHMHDPVGSIEEESPTGPDRSAE
jgi:hypothetical protein